MYSEKAVSELYVAVFSENALQKGKNTYVTKCHCFFFSFTFLLKFILRRPQNLAKYPPIICPANRIVGGDFAKFCVLPRINELYNLLVN